MELTLIERITESSPLIVLIVLGANVALWKMLTRKDEMLMALQRETLLAMASVTTAVRDLKDALDKGR